MSHRKPWTAADLDTARTMVQAGATYAEIGIVLHRTRKAVEKALGPTMPRKPCLRCSRTRGIRARGLCWSCHATPGVKEKYEPAWQRWQIDDPTEAELDVIIAEQMQHLPPWWRREQERMNQEERYLESMTAEVMRACSLVRKRGVGLSQPSR